MLLRYPAIQNADMDEENANHQIISGSWSVNAAMHDTDNIMGPNRDSTAAKKRRKYLKLYFNTTADSVPWQECMIWVLLR